MDAKLSSVESDEEDANMKGESGRFEVVSVDSSKRRTHATATGTSMDSIIREPTMEDQFSLGEMFARMSMGPGADSLQKMRRHSTRLEQTPAESAKDYWIPYEKEQTDLMVWLAENLRNLNIIAFVCLVLHYYPKPPVKFLFLAVCFGFLSDDPFQILWLTYLMQWGRFSWMIIKDLCRVPRPMWVINDTNLLILERSWTFPSGHTWEICTLGTIVAIFNQSWWSILLAITLSLSVMISRSTLGVHWPMDVMGSGIFCNVFICTMHFGLHDYIWLPKGTNPTKTELLIIPAIHTIVAISLVIMFRFICHWYLPIRASVGERISDPSLFKRTHFLTQIRDWFATYFITVGLYVVYKVRGPSEDYTVDMHTGFANGITHLAIVTSIILGMNWIRGEHGFAMEPFTFWDYMIKIAFSLPVGFAVTATNLLPEFMALD